MKKTLIIILILISTNLIISQTYRNNYSSVLHLTDNPESGFEYTILAPTGLTSSYTFSLPPTLGNPGEILTSLGNGSYTWTDPSVNSTNPGGANTQIQFSLSNQFAGSSNLTWDNSLNILRIGTSNGDFNLNVSDWLVSGQNGISGNLSLHTGNASGYTINFKPNSNMTESATLTFPESNGFAGQFLVTDGMGNLYWTSGAVGGTFDCEGQGTGGGSGNTAGSDDSFIGGGNGNNVDSGSDASTIGGGASNEITGTSTNSAIIVGTSNQVNGDSDNSIIASGSNNQITDADNSAICSGDLNKIASGGDNTIIGSGINNYINTLNSVIVTGNSNTINLNSNYGIIGSGRNNVLQYGLGNGIMSGYNNSIIGTSGTSLNYSSISGGLNNSISGSEGFNHIGGGRLNEITGSYSSISGGYNNMISSDYSSILGGNSNTISGDYSMVFGHNSSVSANYSVAIGRRAIADNQGAFLLADGNDSELNSSSTNRMEMRFSGGYRFFTNTGLSTGMTLSAGGSSWAAVSDKNLKSNILVLSYNNIFELISDLKISTWTYKFSEDKRKRNYGPMAQDFFNLFGKDEYGDFGSNKTIISNHLTNIGLASLKGVMIEYEKTKLKLVELNLEQEEIINELLKLEQEIDLMQNKIGELK